MVSNCVEVVCYIDGVCYGFVGFEFDDVGFVYVVEYGGLSVDGVDVEDVFGL